MADDPKAIWTEYLTEAWNKGNYTAIDSLIADDFIDHTPTGDQGRGREGIRWFVTTTRTAFPDVQGRIERIISQGDTVAVYVVFEGTQTGEFMGIPPSGKRVRLAGLDILKIVNGQIAHSWANFDILGMMAQLGAVPAGPQTQEGPSGEGFWSAEGTPQ